MTEKAPERVWGGGRGLPGYITDGPVRGVYDVEYVRADIHQALAAEVERLRVALSGYERKVSDYAHAEPAISDLAYDWLNEDGGNLARAALEEGKDG